MKKMETFLFVVALSMVLCVFVSPAMAGYVWESETIDTAPGSSYGWWSSIGVISDDDITIIHGGGDNYNWDRIRRTHWTGSGWESEYISGMGTSGHVSDELQVQAAWDSYGVAHVVSAYWTSPLREVLHTYWTGAGWVTETVTSNVGQADYVAIAVGPNGHPHIVYGDSGYDDVGGSSSDALIYAKWNGASWDIEVIDAGSTDYAYPSIAVDSSGNPHISYSLGYNEGDLWYGKREGGSWSLEPVVTDIRCEMSDIELDSGGKPHIVFSDWTGHCLGYVEKTGASWDDTYLDCNEAYAPSITFDASDHPHIAYVVLAPFNANLHYATYDGLSWTEEVVDNTQETFWYGTDIKVVSGTVYIPYQNFYVPDGGLKYAKRFFNTPTPTPTPTTAPSPSPTPTATPTVTPTPNFTDYGSAWHFFWYVPFFEVEQGGAFPFIKAADGTLIESCSVPVGECVLDTNYVNAIYVIYTESRDVMWAGIRNLGITITNTDGTDGTAEMRLFIVNLAAYIPLPASMHANWAVGGDSLWNFVFKYDAGTLSGIRVWWVIIFALMVVTWLVAGKKRVHPHHPKKREVKKKGA